MGERYVWQGVLVLVALEWLGLCVFWGSQRVITTGQIPVLHILITAPLFRSFEVLIQFSHLLASNR